MVVEKEDLGLSLSLRSSEDHHALQLNIMPSTAMASSAAPPFLMQKSPWNDVFASAGETRLFLRGIDVNRMPSGDCEEEAGVSSPNSTLSSVSGKRSERDPSGEEIEIERACSRGMSDDEDGGDASSRKKLRLSKDQSAVLEESFKEHNTLNPKQKLALAKQLNLRPRQVEVWFQNRRARTKLKQTEVDCEFLKRCCENLTEENRRLQKEVQELRALKLSPQLYMHMTPPTTLTMCPSCERPNDGIVLDSHIKGKTAFAPSRKQYHLFPPLIPLSLVKYERSLIIGKSMQPSCKSSDSEETHFKNSEILNKHTRFFDIEGGNSKKFGFLKNPALVADVSSMCSVIGEWTEIGLYEDAIGLYLEILSFGVLADEFSCFSCLIKVFGKLWDLGKAKQIHGHVLKIGAVKDVYIHNSLIAMCWECGAVEDAVDVFDRMWTCLIECLN